MSHDLREFLAAANTVFWVGLLPAVFVVHSIVDLVRQARGD